MFTLLTSTYLALTKDLITHKQWRWISYNECTTETIFDCVVAVS